MANQDWFISNAFSCSGGGDVTNQFLGLRGQAVARRNDELAIGFHVGEYGRMYALPAHFFCDEMIQTVLEPTVQDAKFVFPPFGSRVDIRYVMKMIKTAGSDQISIHSELASKMARSAITPVGVPPQGYSLVYRRDTAGLYDLRLILRGSGTSIVNVPGATIGHDLVVSFRLVVTDESFQDRIDVYQEDTVGGGAWNLLHTELVSNTASHYQPWDSNGFTGYRFSEFGNVNASFALVEVPIYRYQAQVDDTGAYPSFPAPPHLWSMNDADTAGGVLTDIGSVGGSDATIVGGVETGDIGVANEGYDFDGSTGYLRLPDGSLDVNAQDFSVAAWVNWDGGAGGASKRIIQNRGTGFLGTVPGWNLMILDSEVPSLHVDDGAGNFIDIMLVAAVVQNVWTHIGVTWENATGTAKVYVNGKQAGTATNAALIGANLTSGRASTIGVAADGLPGALSQWWSGLLDEVVVYPSALLTAGEMFDVYREGTRSRSLVSPAAEGFPAPLHLWRMDDVDTGGGVLTDGGVTGGFDATIVGGITTGVVGQVKEAYDFDGTTGYLRLPDGSLDINAQDFSVAAWVLWDIGNDASAKQIIQNRGPGLPGSFPGWFLRLEAAENVNFFLDDGAGNVVQAGSPVSIPVTGNVWTHIAVTWENATGTAKLYVDGVSRHAASDPALIGADFTSGVASTIGVDADGLPGTVARWWSGLMDEVAFWPGVLLTTSQIFDIYRQGRKMLSLV